MKTWVLAGCALLAGAGCSKKDAGQPSGKPVEAPVVAGKPVQGKLDDGRTYTLQLPDKAVVDDKLIQVPGDCRPAVRYDLSVNYIPAAGLADTLKARVLLGKVVDRLEQPGVVGAIVEEELKPGDPLRQVSVFVQRQVGKALISCNVDVSAEGVGPQDLLGPAREAFAACQTVGPDSAGSGPAGLVEVKELDNELNVAARLPAAAKAVQERNDTAYVIEGACDPTITYRVEPIDFEYPADQGSGVEMIDPDSHIARSEWSKERFVLVEEDEWDEEGKKYIREVQVHVVTPDGAKAVVCEADIDGGRPGLDLAPFVEQGLAGCKSMTIR